ncbi:aminoacyl-tRNA hydrolase [Mycoplasma leonicaptivi]|uniref:aminoacyl-tRNA hydrolase n=1 Tax=Mycoplasma leonicaptivi TaxID=36742 RepID=UPI00047F5234|nr:aminoacyl-tRNA hydrolase [Mycoplasma leonicaptivi]
MKLIVGLGNPGEAYKYTRHNVGFLVADIIAKKTGLKFQKSKFNGEFVKTDDFILAKPFTYMNLSGVFIKEVADFYKIDISDILIIHDEKDLDLGQSNLKVGGSGGSHNGVKSVINSFGGDTNFKRIKIGIREEFLGELRDFVLGKFSKESFNKLIPILDEAADASLSFVYNDVKIVMNKYNQRRNNEPK